MALNIAQDYTYKGDDWWRWWVWIEGSAEELDSIDYVTYKLHNTFPNPIRKITDRETKFRLETGGWGVFRIYARVFLKSDLEIDLEYDVELEYPDDALKIDEDRRKQ